MSIFQSQAKFLSRVCLQEFKNKGGALQMSVADYENVRLWEWVNTDFLWEL